MGKVLGVDLACSWKSLGSAQLDFDEGGWTACIPGVIKWPDGPCDPQAVADAIQAFALANGIAAVSLDGPQAWRDPQAARTFVGRQCELETRTPGKTGCYNVTYPITWHRWVAFCIDVFEVLLAGGHAILGNDPHVKSMAAPPGGKFLLLECFPTSTWRSSRLPAMGGHTISAQEIAACALRLQTAYGLPENTSGTSNHDDLQAVVAALPAAALLGGPGLAIPRGAPSRRQAAVNGNPSHLVEGLIWDAAPKAFLETGAVVATRGGSPRPAATTAVAPGPDDGDSSRDICEAAKDRENLILPDSRDPSSNEVLARGVALFERLVALANAGRSVGIGYAQFVQHVYNVSSFAQVTGRPFAQRDAGFVIRLAVEVTKEAGGRKNVTKNGVTIAAGMDTFIWTMKSGHDRPAGAWKSQWSVPPYSREDWEAVFPDGTRSLLAT